jgi:hypothetical protein
LQRSQNNQVTKKQTNTPTQNYKKKRTNTIIMLVVGTKNAVRSLFLTTVVVLAKTTLAQVRFEAIVSGFARSFAPIGYHAEIFTCLFHQ